MGLNDLTPENTILGATDETDIGNIGDALKVSFPVTSFDQQGRLRTSEHRTLF